MNLGWLRAVLWWLAWLALAALPLAIALAPPRPMAAGAIEELGRMLGLVGLGVLVAQAAISGRQRWFAPGLGQDDLLQFHRVAGIAAVVLLLCHPLLMFAGDRAFLAWLDPRAGLLRALTLAGLALALLALVASSLWRLALRLSYEHWRLLHGLLAVAVVAGGLGHALMAGHYTGAGWKRASLAMLALASIALVLETRLLRPWRLRRRPWRVVAVRPERAGCTTLELAPEGHDGLRFAPGQYAWLTLGERPLRLQQHPFSMASPAGQRNIAFTIKAQGDFTDALADVEPGTTAWLEGPYGVFTWRPGSCPAGAVFIAGGVGITPIMSMLRTARARGGHEPLWLVYGNPAWDEVLFREELDGLAAALPLTLVHVLEEGHAGWQGETGHIDAALLRRHLPADLSRMAGFICGPPALADAAGPVLLGLGLPARNLYAERFDLV